MLEKTEERGTFGAVSQPVSVLTARQSNAGTDCRWVQDRLQDLRRSHVFDEHLAQSVIHASTVFLGLLAQEAVKPPGYVPNCYINRLFHNSQ